MSLDMKRILTALILSSAAGTAACSKPAPPEALLVTVDDQGYHPDTVYAPPGKTTKITFKRTSEFGCGDELVFPELKIKRELPLDTPVVVDVPMPATGSLSFTCGMAMYKGKVVAR